MGLTEGNSLDSLSYAVAIVVWNEMSYQTFNHIVTPESPLILNTTVEDVVEESRWIKAERVQIGRCGACLQTGTRIQAALFTKRLDTQNEVESFSMSVDCTMDIYSASAEDVTNAPHLKKFDGGQ